jgi:transposase
VARLAACQDQGLIGLHRSEPRAWETSHGPEYNIRRFRYEQGDHRGGDRGKWPKQEMRFFGTIASRPNALRKLLEKLAKQHHRLAFCYEASPTGYGLYRQIRTLGHDCQLVAPSMVPVRPGGHIKIDRRDATTLVALFHAGDLTPIWVPDAAHEAMRDLARGRQAAMEGLRRARHQLLSFLLRQSYLSDQEPLDARPSPLACRAALRARRPADRL